MHLRRPLYGMAIGLCLVLCPTVRAAQVRSQNFVVTAPDQQTAQQFAQMAEKVGDDFLLVDGDCHGAAGHYQ